MKKFVDKFYRQQDERKKSKILGEILSYLNEAMAQELIHQREQFYTSSSSIHVGVSMKDFCNYASMYVDHSSLLNSMRLISLLQAGVDSKITFVAIEKWKLSIKASNAMENQHSIGVGQIGLRAAYQASNNVKFYSALSTHQLSLPSLRAGIKLYYDNYFVKPQFSYAKGEFDYQVCFGGKLFNWFDFKETYSVGSSQSEVQVGLGSAGILKTSVSKDFVNNTISVTPTWQFHLTDDIISQLDVQFTSNGHLTLAQTLNYIYSAGKRLGVITQIGFKKNELNSLTFSLILQLQGFTIKIPITLGDEAELSSMLISSGVALIGHLFAYCFHSFSGRLIHNEKNYVRFMKFSSLFEIFQNSESELAVQQPRGNVSIERAFFGDKVAIRNLQRKKKRNFQTPSDCDQYLKYSLYEVTLYLRSKLLDGRRWALHNEILKDKMLFDPTWREDKRKCAFYIIVKRREQVEDLFWNPEKQHLLLII